jgi:hypothetical protein
MKCFSLYRPVCKYSVLCRKNRNANGINLHFRLVLSFLASLSFQHTCHDVATCFSKYQSEGVSGYRIKTSRISDSAAYIVKAYWTLVTLHFVLRFCACFIVVGFNI